MNFIELCVEGLINPEMIDLFIDEWHDSDSSLEIYKYLGMTDEEYSVWVDQPNFINKILNNRIKERKDIKQ